MSHPLALVTVGLDITAHRAQAVNGSLSFITQVMHIIYYYYIGTGDLDTLLKRRAACRPGRLNGEMFCSELFAWCGGNAEETRIPPGTAR